MAKGYYNQPSIWKSFWSAIGFSGRLFAGILLVTFVGWLGLGPAASLNLTIPWPYATIWAAIGWGRTGWTRAPIAPLLFFGFLQDIAFLAPLGLHAIVNVLCFASSVLLLHFTETQRNAEIQLLVPMIVTVIGFFLYWLIASFWMGTSVFFIPILASCLVTAGTYYFVGSLFDLKDPLA